MANKKELAKDAKEAQETEIGSDANRAIENAKKIKPKEDKAKEEKAQASLKPVDPKEIAELNDQIMSKQDVIDEHKEEISNIKAEIQPLRDKRKELVQALKAQKAQQQQKELEGNQDGDTK